MSQTHIEDGLIRHPMSDWYTIQGRVSQKGFQHGLSEHKHFSSINRGLTLRCRRPHQWEYAYVVIGFRPWKLDDEKIPFERHVRLKRGKYIRKYFKTLLAARAFFDENCSVPDRLLN